MTEGKYMTVWVFECQMGHVQQRPPVGTKPAELPCGLCARASSQSVKRGRGASPIYPALFKCDRRVRRPATSGEMIG